MYFTTAAFWRDAISRAVATGAEAALAMAGADAAGWIQIGWRPILATAGVAAVLTVVRCLAKPGDLIETGYHGRHIAAHDGTGTIE